MKTTINFVTLAILLLTLSGCASQMSDPNCYSYKHCPERINSITPNQAVLEKYRELNAPLPIKITPPLHPKYAIKNGIEGWVVLQFDISPTGRAINIKVIEASPKGIFEKNSIEALKHSIFEQTENGFKDKTQRHEFRLY